MDIFDQIAQRIVADQQLIIGPLAVEEAKRVKGLSFDTKTNELFISGDKKKSIDELISRYEQLFGQASIEVCRDAAAPLIPQLKSDEIPTLLQ